MSKCTENIGVDDVYSLEIIHITALEVSKWLYIIGSSIKYEAWAQFWLLPHPQQSSPF